MFLVSAPFLLVASPIVLVSPPNFSYQRFHSFLFQRVDLPGARARGLPTIGGSPPRGARIIRGGMRDESRKKSNPNGRRTQKSAHKRAEREPKSEEKKKEKRRTKMNE